MKFLYKRTESGLVGHAHEFSFLPLLVLLAIHRNIKEMLFKPFSFFTVKLRFDNFEHHPPVVCQKRNVAPTVLLCCQSGPFCIYFCTVVPRYCLKQGSSTLPLGSHCSCHFPRLPAFRKETIK
jgi:hypothetical protein